MSGPLTQGAYNSRTGHLYIDTADYVADPLADPVWTEITRKRNLQDTDGSPLTDVEFDGASAVTAIPGLPLFNGSFELLRRRGIDAVYELLRAAKVNQTILCLLYLNQAITVENAQGWRAPVLLGEFSEPRNGNDGVVVTIPFALADAYDSNGDPFPKVDVRMTGDPLVLTVI